MSSSPAVSTSAHPVGTPMIEVRGLEKTFRQGAKEIRALRGVDLAVAPGRIHGIIGQSGAGKSTLVRCLTLLEPPTSGTVSVAGKDLTRESRSGLLDSRRRIGMVFQHANLFSSRTARDNVAYPLEVAGGSDAAARRARADELLALVGLEGFEGSYPAQLSGGQKQRVGIARALASDPDVLLCDEPTSALDPASTEGVLTLIQDLSRRLGLTVLVITHEMHVVKRLCHEVSLLQDGRIVQSGDLGAVAADLDSPLSSALLPLPAPHAAPDQRLVEVLGRGAAASLPITQLVRDAGAGEAEILAGTVEDLAGERFSHQLLGLSGTEAAADAAVARLQEAGLTARTRAGRQASQDQHTADEIGGAR